MLTKHVWLFGGLGAALLVLLAYGRFALWRYHDLTEWLLAGGALTLVLLGYGLRTLVPSPLPTAPPITSPAEPAGPAPDLSAPGISEREYDVLTLMAQGLSNREIADRLFIAESTVKTHVSNLFVKLNARRRTEAIQNARLRGLI